MAKITDEKWLCDCDKSDSETKKKTKLSKIEITKMQQLPRSSVKTCGNGSVNSLSISQH